MKFILALFILRATICSSYSFLRIAKALNARIIIFINSSSTIAWFSFDAVNNLIFDSKSLENYINWSEIILKISFVLSYFFTDEKEKLKIFHNLG